MAAAGGLRRRLGLLRADATIRDLATGLVLIGCSLLLLGLAAADAVWAFTILGALSVVLVVVTVRRLPAIDAVLAAQGVSPLYRHALRDAAVLTLVIREWSRGVVDSTGVAVVSAGLALVWLVALATALANGLLARLATPVPSQGLGLRDSAVDHPILPRLLDLGAVVLLVAPVSLLAATRPALIGGAVVVTLGALVAAATTAVATTRALLTRAPGVAQVRAALGDVAPQVMLYSPGGASDAYQVSMWLPVLADLSQRSIVVVRDRGMFDTLVRQQPPSVALICIPNTLDLVNLGFETVRAVLYPGNFGENIHMLRQPGLRHVFIGHGDSDKMASANPFSRVYAEVWVAGPAGRERYALADVGVRDECVIEVGRPQLDALTGPVSRPRGQSITVLYAPTWEGWVDTDQRSSSVATMGERLVAALLAEKDVRVIYKPHPLGGVRLRSARSADARIRTLLRRAGAGTDISATGHVIATASLYPCFAESDLLITDISSVLVDYVKTEKPCVVTNAHGIANEQLRAEVASARGSYLLGAECAELPQILADLHTGHDPWQEERRKLRAYLLGPDDPPAMARFQREITRLCVQARVVPAARSSEEPTTRPAA
jgi:CDP-Glycerol:Poly(glycerophosphate) glycerophosphotransferase